MVIREWYRDYGQESVSAGAGPNRDDGLLRWLFIQLAGLGWVVSALAGSFLAWDTRGNLLQGFYAFVGKPVAFGRVQLSLLGVMYALLVLFVTYIITRLGRFLLQEKVLVGRKLERGVKDSTTAITVYLLWALGIVVALGVLGVNTTSLAVVFGALSIGIGFGLQNIFNNFVSGIILLIERPIQVGDAVEVSGIWGEVRKINVRSTVVQTYDNASLIIPNSDFISSQVTNWSFKDQRIRRKITVGVAYGSDVELVRKTLLEIAADTPSVLKDPPPDVHFLEHGDSALIFMLRYWTHVDYYYMTSTDIRFAIDRLFRERGIEIAFPQRDIHIRSIAGTSPAPIDRGAEPPGDS
jgi:small-conductance mechanosensitive channel